MRYLNKCKLKSYTYIVVYKIHLGHRSFNRKLKAQFDLNGIFYGNLTYNLMVMQCMYYYDLLFCDKAFEMILSVLEEG